MSHAPPVAVAARLETPECYETRRWGYRWLAGFPFAIVAILQIGCWVFAERTARLVQVSEILTWAGLCAMSHSGVPRTTHHLTRSPHLPRLRPFRHQCAEAPQCLFCAWQDLCSVSGAPVQEVIVDRCSPGYLEHCCCPPACSQLDSLPLLATSVLLPWEAGSMQLLQLSEHS